MIVERNRPFVGLSSYTEEHEKYFYGRDQEIKELTNKIRINTVTVLHGKSGLGKTSLLKAGIIRAHLKKITEFPVYIRIDFNNRNIDPLDYIKSQIVQSYASYHYEISKIETTLWEYFHGNNIKKDTGIDFTTILLFDQFEEIFTIGKEKSDDLIRELSYLSENKVPPDIDVENFDLGRNNYRILFSLRSDYLPDLEKLKKNIPNILSNSFAITQMNSKKALDVITKSAPDIIPAPTAKKIISIIISSKGLGTKKSEDNKVEPLILNLICYQLNETRINQNKPIISTDDVSSFKVRDITRIYYENEIHKYSNKIGEAIEKELVNEEGHRVIKPVSDLRDYKISDENIDSLINARILRKEIQDNNVEYVELIHDVLAPIVSEKRKARKSIEQVKKRTKYILTIVTSIFSIFMTALSILVYFQSKEAIGLKESAIKNKNEAIHMTVKAKNNEILAVLEKIKSDSLKEISDSLAIESNNQKELAIVNQNKALKNAKEANRQRGIADKQAYIALQQIEIVAEKADSLESAITTISILSAAKSSRDLSDQINEGEIEIDPTDVIKIALKALELDSLNNHAASFLIKAFKKSLFYRTIYQGNEPIRYIWPSSDGKYIITGSRVNGFLFESKNYQMQNEYSWPNTSTKNYTITQDGKNILASGDDKIYSIDLKSKATNVFLSHDAPINFFEFSPDGRYFIVADSTGLISFWSSKVENLNEIYHDGEPKIIRFSDDGKYLLAGGKEKIINIWEINDPVKVKKLSSIKTTGEITYAEFSHHQSNDSLQMVFSLANGDIGLASVISSDPKTFTAHGSNIRVNSVKFSPDNQYIISSGNDKKAKIWDIVNENKLIIELIGHEEGVLFATFGTGVNWREILTSSFDGTIRLWVLPLQNKSYNNPGDVMGFIRSDFSQLDLSNE